jgi:hypothetical protein
MKRVWVLLFLAACDNEPAKPPPTRDPMPEKFWTWFQSRSDAILKSDGQALKELARAVKEVHPSLSVEVKPGELIISAGGNKLAFPKVKELADAAPAMKDWKVTAFRPPRKPADVGPLHPEDVFFRVRPGKDGKPALDVFVRNYSDKMQPLVQQMIETALGEYDVEMSVGAIDIKALPKDESKLKPVTELSPAALR